MWSRSVLVLAGTLLAPPLSVSAQDAAPPAPASSPRPGCVLHPSPDCRYFGVTELAFAFGRRSERREDLFSPADRTVFASNAEGGIMRNLGARDGTGGSRDAIGVTWFFKVDGEDVSTGAGARYRRWFTRRRSLDLGLGVPLASSDYERGTLFGLVRYNPTPWFGLSARPEYVRQTTFICAAFRCDPAAEEEFRVLVGADLAGKPGAVTLAGYGIATGVLILLLAAALD